ncbi:MAG TPA: hypothetical protein VMP01_05215 [Pirellulaceae bacterium]|nr:hypothetical protein [Pirellulaceae bacterium]
MTTRSRVEQRDHLMTSLGMLADPIRRLIDSGDSSAAKSVSIIQAQFTKDYQLFLVDVKSYCQVGDAFLEADYHGVRRTVREFNEVCEMIRIGQRLDVAASKYGDVLLRSQGRLRAIPCDDPGTILPPDSPFQTYLRLRAVCAGVTTRLDILDPYLTADVFHRYLADVPTAAMLQVVTHDKVMSGSDTVRRDRIVAISELVAIERKDRYRFLVTGQQHDRHCRADNEILHFGGSLKDASKTAPYTISRLDPVQSNHAFLDAVIAGAGEWCGPKVATHRRA